MPPSPGRLAQICWLWTMSARVFDRGDFVALTRRVRFFARALLAYSSIKPLLEAPSDSALGRLMFIRPETIGTVVWPYQCSGWNTRTRLFRLIDHYAIIEQIHGPLDFRVDDKLLLVDLAEIREGLSVVVDQPKWFMREGQLTINLFLVETRIYSLSFSFFRRHGSLAAFIGAIQGRDIEGINDEYRELTKAAHGLRPRDLLVETFRMLCVEMGVEKIFAVSDQYRHHRHPYFGKPEEKLSANYDEIWSDRGGVRVEPMYYELEVRGQERDLAAIPSKKRGMYRRRSEMLTRLRSQMHERYQQANVREETNDAGKAQFSIHG